MCLFLSIVTKLQKYRMIIGVWGNGAQWSRRPCLALYWYGLGCNLLVTHEKKYSRSFGGSAGVRKNAELMTRLNYALFVFAKKDFCTVAMPVRFMTNPPFRLRKIHALIRFCCYINSTNSCFWHNCLFPLWSVCRCSHVFCHRVCE